MTVAELIERLKTLPPDMPVLRDSECAPGLHPIDDLIVLGVGVRDFHGRQITQYSSGPDAYEALVF